MVGWRRHGWENSTWDIGYKELQDKINQMGELFSIRWVPSHMETFGNEQADV